MAQVHLLWNRYCFLSPNRRGKSCASDSRNLLPFFPPTQKLKVFGRDLVDRRKQGRRAHFMPLIQTNYWRHKCESIMQLPLFALVLVRTASVCLLNLSQQSNGQRSYLRPSAGEKRSEIGM